MKQLLAATLFALLTFDVMAEPNKDYPHVDDTSFTESNGNRVIQLAVDVPATTSEVWRALSTAEGWKSFAVAFAELDFRVGGILETAYKADAQVGNPNNIKNQIVAYVPGRLLAFRCVQAPQNFQHKEEFFSTATTMEIAPLAGQKSRVTLTAVGYRPGEAFDTLHKHFRWGNAYTLDKLRLRFETGNSAAPTETKEVKDFNARKPAQ